MNLSNTVNKWGPLALAVVCVFLAIRLFSELNSPATRASTSQALAVAQRQDSRRAQSPGNKQGREASDDQSSLHLDEWKDLEGRSLPDIARDPFNFGPVAPPKSANGGASGSSATAPPPPPPIPLKAFGFSEDEQGRRMAYLANTEEVFVVKKGTLVSKRFKVLEITPVMVEVEDATSGQKAELPIPQEK